MGGAALEGLVEDPEDAVALFEAGTGVSLEPVPPPRHRRPDGRRGHPVDVDVRARGPGHRRAHPLLAQRGPRQGAAVRRLRPRRADPAALDARRARPAAADRGPRDRADRRTGRRHRHPHPDAADGRRGPQPQPGRHADAAARPRPRDGRVSGADAGFSRDVAEALRFVGGNDHFFLNLAMPACKLALDAARGIEGSTMVVAMARNGTDFGIQVAGTGDEWFTGPAQVAEGLFLGDYGPDDANPDIGDSAITETAGIGGFAMATAPAIVRLVGGIGPRRARHHPADARDHARREPALDGAGAGVPGRPERHRRHPGVPDRHPAADQHRHGRQAGRRRPGRRRAGHPAGARSSRRRSPRWPSGPAPAAEPAGPTPAHGRQNAPVDVDVAGGAQRRALLEVALPRLVVVARRQRAVGAHHAPPRHRAAVRRHDRADLAGSAAPSTAPTTSAIAPYVVTRPRGTRSTQDSTCSTYSSVVHQSRLAGGERHGGHQRGANAAARPATQIPGGSGCPRSAAASAHTAGAVAHTASPRSAHSRTSAAVHGQVAGAVRREHRGHVGGHQAGRGQDAPAGAGRRGTPGPTRPRRPACAAVPNGESGIAANATEQRQHQATTSQPAGRTPASPVASRASERAQHDQRRAGPPGRG